MSKEQTPIEILEKKMQSFAMKSYQYNELNALIQEIKTEREQYAQAKVLEALERERGVISEFFTLVVEEIGLQNANDLMNEAKKQK